MNINELFKDLSYGELSNLALANDGNGTIRDEDKPKILNYTNEALLRLHSKFVLIENNVLLQLVTGITNYHLNSKFAFTNETSTATKYIMDLPYEPFSDDVLKVLEVYDHTGTRVPLNDAECMRSVYTPRATVLQVPHAEDGMQLSLLYQAKHPKLSMDYLDDEISLPDVLMGALRAYIAYSTYSHMNTETSTIKAQEHLAMYNGICEEVEEKDLVNGSISATNTRFAKRGWV